MTSPWFKCYPDDFLGGLADLSTDEQAFYVQLVFRMYDAADAIYVDDKRIARWCNSNARKWNRVKEALIDAGKLTVLRDGGLINRRALREMIKNSDRVPEKVKDRLAKLSQMFEESLGKDSQKFGETSPENTKKTAPLKEARSQKPETKPNGFDGGVSPQPLKAKTRKVTKRGSRLSETWSPTPTDYAHASKRGLTPQEVNHEADQFRNHHLAKGTVSKDWAASWRTWCGNASKWKAERSANRGASGGAAGSTNSAFDLLDRLHAVSPGQDDPGSLQEDDAFTIDHEPMAAGWR